MFSQAIVNTKSHKNENATREEMPGLAAIFSAIGE